MRRSLEGLVGQERIDQRGLDAADDLETMAHNFLSLEGDVDPSDAAKTCLLGAQLIRMMGRTAGSKAGAVWHHSDIGHDRGAPTTRVRRGEPNRLQPRGEKAGAAAAVAGGDCTEGRTRHKYAADGKCKHCGKANPRVKARTKIPGA